MYKKILLFVVILIFILSSCYEFSNYYMDKKYVKMTTLNTKLANISNSITNTTIKEQLNDINNDVAFIQSQCLENDI